MRGDVIEEEKEIVRQAAAQETTQKMSDKQLNRLVIELIEKVIVFHLYSSLIEVNFECCGQIPAYWWSKIQNIRLFVWKIGIKYRISYCRFRKCSPNVINVILGLKPASWFFALLFRFLVRKEAGKKVKNVRAVELKMYNGSKINFKNLYPFSQLN